jgi:hypothetical protein
VGHGFHSRTLGAGGSRVALEQLAAVRWLPKSIMMDNRPEFISRAPDI